MSIAARLKWPMPVFFRRFAAGQRKIDGDCGCAERAGR
jgi:hypothetical protein